MTSKSSADPFSSLQTEKKSRLWEYARKARSPAANDQYTHRAAQKTKGDKPKLASLPTLRCSVVYSSRPRLRRLGEVGAGLTSPAPTVGVGCGGVAPLGIIQSSTQSSSRKPPLITTIRA